MLTKLDGRQQEAVCQIFAGTATLAPSERTCGPVTALFRAYIALLLRVQGDDVSCPNTQPRRPRREVCTQ